MIKPTAHKKVKVELPPLDKIGIGTPTKGNKLIVIAIFKKKEQNIYILIAKAKNFL